MLTLLTATGCRPQAWALCERWMARQTYAGPVRWVVVDDGEQPQPVTFQRAGWRVEVLRPQPFWRPGDNTQARNLITGLSVIAAGERVVIIEDDDWYAPAWLETVAARMGPEALVGESRARYYNVATKVGRELTNHRHASLCATAMSGRALQLFRQVAKQHHKFIDLELWRRYGRGWLMASHQVVGIKGLPGRGGIGMGHADTFRGESDLSGRLLRSWIGDDAEFYR